MHRQPARGFTLIELLVVIAIIAILAGILFPVFAQARQKAEQSACISNLNQIAKAILMYADDYDQKLVLSYQDADGTSSETAGDRFWPWIVTPYIKDYRVHNCPAFPVDQTYNGQIHPQTNASNYGVSYGYNHLLARSGQSGIKITRVRYPAKTVLLFEMGDGTPTGWNPLQARRDGNPGATLAPHEADAAANLVNCVREMRANHSGDEVENGADTGLCMTAFTDGHVKPLKLDALLVIGLGENGNMFNPRR